MKTENNLIKQFKKMAKVLKILGVIDNYKDFAQKQIDQIINDKPNEEETVLEQMNEEQKECYKYLQKVAETNRL